MLILVGGGYNDDTILKDAISSYDGLFICAAGNESTNLDLDNVEIYPAKYNMFNLITVGALNESGNIHNRSNYGETSVEIFAPGSNIVSTFGTHYCEYNYVLAGNVRMCELSKDALTSCINLLNEIEQQNSVIDNDTIVSLLNHIVKISSKYEDKEYEEINKLLKSTSHILNGLHTDSGTSYATPFVTGVAAILLSINPSLTPYQIKNAILSGADNIQISITNGSSSNSTVTQNVKKLNAYGAVKYVISNYIDEQFLQAYGTDTEEYITLLPNQRKFYKLNVQSKRNYRITFSGNRDVDIKFYDSNYNEISITDLKSSQQDEELIIELEKSVYYIKLENLGDSSGNFKFIINSFDSQYINSLKTYDLLLNYNNKVQTYYFKNNNGIGFYDFILTGQKSDGTSILYPQGIISINNSYDSTIYNLNIPETQNRAINNANNNCVTAFLYNDKTFNIQLNVNDINLIKLTLTVRKSENFKIDLFDLSSGTNVEMLMLEMSDEVDLIKEYQLLQDGLFDLEIRYAGQQADPILFKIYKPIYNQSLDMYLLSSIFVENISIDNMITTINNIELKAGLYYICYFENELEGSIDVKLTRKMNINENDVLVSDPKDPSNYNITCGSMINIYEYDLSLNSKSFRGTSIIQGFTRIIYIESNVCDYINNTNNNYNYISRESYNWYSSNEDVLSVSNYGTVFGKSVGTAKIMAVHKDDPSVFFLKTFDVEYDFNSYCEKVVSVITNNHKLSDGRYLINLTIQNCPYPSIEYYYWQIVFKDSTIIDVSIDKWGHITIVGTGTIIIEGINYRYNNNYAVRIILDVTN